MQRQGGQPSGTAASLYNTNKIICFREDTYCVVHFPTDSYKMQIWFSLYGTEKPIFKVFFADSQQWRSLSL
jgi:hypothetical protein